MQDRLPTPRLGWLDVRLIGQMDLAKAGRFGQAQQVALIEMGAHRRVAWSLVATWELRGLDPVTEFLALLRAPRPPVEIAPV